MIIIDERNYFWLSAKERRLVCRLCNVRYENVDWNNGEERSILLQESVRLRRCLGRTIIDTHGGVPNAPKKRSPE